MENTPQSRTTIQKIYDSIKRILNNFTSEGRYRNFVQDLEVKWREAYRQITTEQAVSNLNGETKYAQKTLKDGTKYIETENNLFTKEDGTPMSQREIYNSLVGKQITFNDGITATIVNRLPSKDMYNELFKRYPNYKNVKDIKGVNNNINENMVELLENSNNISSDEPDYMGRHKDNKIDSFDTRRVSFYDGKNAYDLDNFAQKKGAALDKTSLSITTGKPVSSSFSANNIPQSNLNVKSDTSS